jgi:hypothetical protein
MMKNAKVLIFCGLSNCQIIANEGKIKKYRDLNVLVDSART